MSARVVFVTLHVAMNHRRYIAWFHSTAQVAVGTWRAADCRPYGFAGGFYLCARCSYSAERGTAPHPPPMAVPLPRRGRFCAVPFIRTGYIRYVACGDESSPLHCVVPFNRTGCSRDVAGGYYVKKNMGTSRPYRRFPFAPVVAAMRNVVPRCRLWRLPFPGGKGFLLCPLFGRGGCLRRCWWNGSGFKIDC